MSALEAYRKSLTHRHVWTPFPTDGLDLERCECGALRTAQQPETD